MSNTVFTPGSDGRVQRPARPARAATLRSLAVGVGVSLVAGWLSTTHWWFIVAEFLVWLLVPFAHLYWTRRVTDPTVKRAGSPLVTLPVALLTTVVVIVAFRGHVDEWVWEERDYWMFTQIAGAVIGLPISFLLGYFGARAATTLQTDLEAPHEEYGTPAGSLPLWVKVRLWFLLPATGWATAAVLAGAGSSGDHVGGTSTGRGTEATFDGFLVTLGIRHSDATTLVWIARGFALMCVALLWYSSVLRRREEDKEQQQPAWVEDLPGGDLPPWLRPAGQADPGTVPSATSTTPVVAPAPGPQVQAGWYRTQDGAYWRWHDGTRWTEDVRPVR